MTISREDALALDAAFKTAQALTRAPLVGVLAEASSDYAVAPMLASFLIALATPWPLLFYTTLSAERVFAAQLAVCLVALALSSFAQLRIALTPARTRRGYAHRAALVQFAIRGLDRAPGHDAVLIYVSLAERYARVIAGEQASKVVSAAQWQGFVDALTADMASKGARAALSAAAARAADLMAPHFPPHEGAAPVGPRFHAL